MAGLIGTPKKIHYHEAVKAFDKKFGPDFVAALPCAPGIYRVFNDGDVLIYVGKAKNLRRRIGQYRNAKRRKRHLKMRSIVSEASRIEVEVSASELEACLTETRVIQEHRPKWNVAGAFYFLYPMLGIRHTAGILSLLYTTEPEALDPSLLASFSMHGAFRSRYLCGGGFFSLMELMEYVGHKNRTEKPSRRSFLYSFRQMERSWKDALEELFRGESPEALEKLVFALVENAAARRRGAEIQSLLNDVRRFWRHEAQLLFRALRRDRRSGTTLAYPVPQRERDLLFLRIRYGKSATLSNADIEMPVRDSIQ